MATVATVKIGNNVRDLRIGRFLTLQELHEATGISYRQLVRIENNQVDPHFSTIRKLAGFFGVEPSALVDEEQLN